VSSAVRNTTFDCADPAALATFWAAALGYEGTIGTDEDSAWFPEPGGDGKRGLLFIVVPEGKTAKNRVHLDLMPSTTRDEEVERLVGLGATVFADFRDPATGAGFVVMQDPEGNEFCVERSAVERAS
jgi:predicted enzyme related to lactoylglutathione lyase